MIAEPEWPVALDEPEEADLEDGYLGELVDLFPDKAAPALLPAALALAAQGFPVVPLHTPTGEACDCRRAGCDKIGKHPRTMNGLTGATTDEDQIRRWWGMWPAANVGLVIPSGFVALDFDVEEASAVLDGRPLPLTATSRTGRGWHFLYRTAEPIPPKVGILRHLDLRGPGSYIVAPPSRHVSGTTYTWIIPPDLEEIADAPAWVLDLARGPMLTVGPGRAEPVADVIAEGERNATLASLAGTMRRRGMSAAAIAAGLLATNAERCRPPLPESEVRTIAASVARYEPAETTAPAPLAEPSTAPAVWTVRQLAEMPSAEEEYIVADGILTRGGKMLVYARSGAGKTTLLDFLAGPLATGRPFLGRFGVDRPRRVLIVQGELSIPEMSSHAQQLVAAGFGDDRLMFARMTDLRLPKGEAALRALVTAQRAEVLALDPWYRLFSGESSDKPEQVGVVFDVCDRLLEDGLLEAVIVVHHANVSGLRTAGSWMFEGWPSTILRLETVAGIPAQRLLEFEKVRAPSSSLLGVRLAIALGEEGYLPVVPILPPIGSGATLARLVVAEAGGQLRRHDLIARLMGRANVRDRAANKYLGQAVQGGLLRKVPDRGQVVYQLGEEAEP
jgi:hypothetical protein